ncbi:glycosyltransferase, partial [Streptococcus agalactiae]|nr:glycosyltransferase [Streptococcus agalactiae]
GEVPYATLPYYLHGFDVCIVPFHITALTLATNPVKVYEYLSAGKPVVSVDLPEMQQFGTLVQVGHDGTAFIAAITRALLPSTAEQIAQRQA